VGSGQCAYSLYPDGVQFWRREEQFLNLFANQLSLKRASCLSEEQPDGCQAVGTVKDCNNLEWNGSVGVQNDVYHLYGTGRHPAFTGDQLKQGFRPMKGSWVCGIRSDGVWAVVSSEYQGIVFLRQSRSEGDGGQYGIESAWRKRLGMIMPLTLVYG